jgi:hypothetical protein
VRLVWYHFCALFDRLYLDTVESSVVVEKLGEEVCVHVEQFEVAAAAFIEVAAKQR